MVDTPSEGAARERERPVQQRESSSLGSAVVLRAVAFIVAMFAVGYLVDFAAAQGVVRDSEMINVLIGIFLSLGFLGILLTAVGGVLALVRRLRR